MKIILVTIILLLGFLSLYILWIFLLGKIRILLGYKLYEYTKILSHGIKVEYKWHRTDKKALESFNHYEFVIMIRPYRKKIKPN